MVFWMVVIFASKFSPTLNDLTDISGLMNASIPSCENLLQTSAMPKYSAESSKNDLSCPIAALPPMKRAPSSVRMLSGEKKIVEHFKVKMEFCKKFQQKFSVALIL